MDIYAKGVFGLNERTFFDVRITHPNAKYNQGKTMEKIYHHQDMEKKRMYNDRIIQEEKASFVPLIFTTSGGLGPECEWNALIRDWLKRYVRNEMKKCYCFVTF